MVLISRGELTDVQREEISFSKAYILVDRNWTAQNLRRAINTLKGALFMDVSDGIQEMSKVLQVALTRQDEKERNSQLMQAMRGQIVRSKN